MSTIDKQRIEAVRTLERFGFTFNGNEWVATAGSAAETSSLTTEADAMHALLMLRADKLGSCAEGSVEATELETITRSTIVRSGSIAKAPPLRCG